MEYNTPLTLQERIKIKDFIQMGYSLSSISRLLGRGKNTVVLEVRRNGGRGSYNPEKAEKQYVNRVAKGHKIAGLKLKGKKNRSIYQQKIENLEMQIEILYETIKEMKNNGQKD